MIRKKRNGASPGLNGLSYIPFKASHSVLLKFHEILSALWEKQIIPAEWAQSFIVPLAKSSKDEDLRNPAEFRPIALTNMDGKLFFSVISRRLEQYMIKNTYIDTSIQKGFLSEVAGCIEHTFGLMQALQDASRERQIVCVFLDLANAYGSVKHNLIQFALEWYHVPLFIRQLIVRYYDLLMAKVVTRDWETKFFAYSIGLFQGCCLSTILFDAVFNLLLDLVSRQHADAAYQFKNIKLHTLLKAYADDLTTITKSPKKAQEVLDTTHKFLEWTITMKAKPKKCRHLAGKIIPVSQRELIKTYGDSTYAFFDANLTINNHKITSVLEGEEPFKFLGRYLPHDGTLKDTEQHERIRKLTKEYLSAIDSAPVNGLMKTWLHQFVLLPKLSWPF